MITIITAFDDCRAFAATFQADPHFSDPMLCSDAQLACNLIRPITQPERHCVLGVRRGTQLTGLFAFLVLHDERYLELLAGLSREQDAYWEVFRYLEQHYPGYQADFVLNPGNYLLKEQLALRSAAFEPEQQKMVLRAAVPAVETPAVELLSQKYAGQYCAIHSKDVYWTGEKVLQAQDRFRTLLAIHDGRVVGYLDVTSTAPENEPFDLFVLEPYRRRGYGRQLLAKALELNRPNGMMLLVDVDNAPAIGLYASMGFVQVTGQNNLTAHWHIPA